VTTANEPSLAAMPNGSSMPNVAAVMADLETIEIQDRPDAAAGPGEAVVAIRAVGVCGSDVAYYRYGRVGPYIVEGDIIKNNKIV